MISTGAGQTISRCFSSEIRPSTSSSFGIDLALLPYQGLDQKFIGSRKRCVVDVQDPLEQIANRRSEFRQLDLSLVLLLGFQAVGISAVKNHTSVSKHPTI